MQELFDTTVLPTQRSDGTRVRTDSLECFAECGCQHRMRADLHEGVEARIEELTGGLLEQDGLPQVRIPVLAVQSMGIHFRPGDRRIERYFRRAGLHSGQDRQ